MYRTAVIRHLSYALDEHTSLAVELAILDTLQTWVESAHQAIERREDVKRIRREVFSGIPSPTDSI